MTSGGWASPRGGRGGRGSRGPCVSVARSAGRWELLVDGIAYSVFDDEAPWSGYVWDALVGAALFHDSAKPSVLLLGCGGGTVLALLRLLRPGARLVGVELEPTMLDFGRRHGLDDVDAELIEADGVDWLQRTRRRFDVIIDDMFAPAGGALSRPVTDEEAHLGRIAGRLNPGGLAISNSTTDDDPPGLEAALERAHCATFPNVSSLEPPLGLNRVLFGSTRPLDARRWAAARQGLDEAADRALEELVLRKIQSRAAP